MRYLVPRRLIGVAVGLGLLGSALVSAGSVGAAPPQIFTNNGCPVGNYSCLQNAIGTNFPTFPFYGGVPYVGVGYGYPYAPAPVYVAPVAATTATATGTISSGTTAVSPGTVAVGQLISLGVGGFTVGESVTASITGPNGQVAQIGPAPAANDGTVTVTFTFPSAGGWQVTVHGQTSNKSVGYQFTAQ